MSTRQRRRRFRPDPLVGDLSVSARGRAILFHIEPLEPGDPVPNVAKWLGRVGLEAAWTPRISARALVRFSGPDTPIGEPDVETRAYAVIDVGTSLRCRRSARRFDLELQNVFDTKYEEIRASGFINPRAPRTLRAALRFADHP